MKDYSGIYKIRNIITNDLYIGQTINLRKRKNSHFHYLRKGKHDNSHFQNAFNKYGEANFKFEVILYCEWDELTRYEQELVNRLKPSYNLLLECVDSLKGYKLREETIKKMSEYMSGENNPHLGTHHSEETKQKMSQSQKGNKNRLGLHNSEESKRKSSESNKGKHNISKETRLKLSESHKGKIMSDEQKKKMSLVTSGSRNGMFGKHPAFSEETRKKLSEAKKGKPLSEEHKKKIGQANIGRKYSEESKQKMRKPKSEEAKRNMSVAQKESWAKRKQSQQQQPIEEGSTNI
jgi:group I intron endonuclease